ncbi:MAG: hypothetical protein HQM09_23475 [Candidatus Riflebacteria bacterium]|nr:hypothetical protein [Candidatus Riflebacteria bacterium]
MPFSLEKLEEIISTRWNTEKSAVDTLVIHGVNSRSYLHLDSELPEEKMFRLLIDYSDIELIKSLLEEIANDADVIIDNDFGTVLPGNQFIERCRTEKEWDWREGMHRGRLC